ncbi:hypothetical protein PINS_up008840 [Pythium insidiosum]|nr:hypothetical protein PINS_up008840 [Pythium insidiosum]
MASTAAASSSLSAARRHLPPFDRVVIIDRMEDPLTMLLTPMTYEGLLDALVGMTHGVVSYEREPETNEPDKNEDDAEDDAANAVPSSSRVKLILNHRDELFDEIRDVNINQLLSRRLAAIAQRLVREVRGGRESSSAASRAQRRRRGVHHERDAGAAHRAAAKSAAAREPEALAGASPGAGRGDPAPQPGPGAAALRRSRDRDPRDGAQAAARAHRR